MYNKEKAAKLLVFIEEEEKTLPEINGFGDSNHKEQYPLVVEYLKTGVVPAYINPNFELLDAVVYDFDCTCSDYGVN